MAKPITLEFVKERFAEGVIDITLGGLVLGNRHSEGGIQVMQFTGDRFFHLCEIEGGEFLVNYFATKKNLERLAEINSYTSSDDEDIAESTLDGIPVYSVPPGHWVLLRTPLITVIRRSATKKYLSELTAINESAINSFPPEEQK